MKTALAILTFFYSTAWAVPNLMGISADEPIRHQINLNGKNVLETRSLTGAAKFFVVLEITKPGDFGYCTGSIIDSRFILTAAHCIHDATKVDVYFYSYDSRNKLRYEKFKTQAHRPLPNWTGGVDMKKPRVRADREKIVDIGLVMVAGIPHTSQPVTIAAPNTATNGGAVAYTFGLDSLFPKPYYSGDRITALSLRSFEPNGRSVLFTGVIPTVTDRKRSGICVGDSGSPVVITDDLSQVILLGVLNSLSLMDDTNIDLDDPRSEKMSEKQCGDFGHFTNISMRLNEIEALKTALLAIPAANLRN